MRDFNTHSRFSAFLLTSMLAVVLFRTAWVCDDAYITMRTVDNFISGYGLVYNLGERVQSYTHPLWLFVLSGLYIFTHEAYYTLILASITLTLVGAVILVRHVAQSQAAAILGITIILFSKSFIDYSTSGLENPLSYLLIIVFMAFYLTMTVGLRKLLAISFVSAMGALNRFDLLLIFFPAVILTLWEVWISVRGQRKRVLLVGLIGFSPLFAWLIFALFYYGFFFPNTAYAKLNTGIPEALLYRQGIGYFLSLLNLDPLTLLVIIWGLATAILSRDRQKLALAVGISFYLGYIISIGGDFMNGRFFAAPFLCAVILLCRSEVIVDQKTLFLPLGLVLFLGLTSPYPPIFSTGNYGQQGEIIVDLRGVSDERAAYYPTTGLLQDCRGCQIPNHQWVKDGMAARGNNNHVEFKTSIGFFGFYAGREKYVSDHFGLADPLLARLPISPLYKWRIGHYYRPLPLGYRETLETGVNQINDAGLREFYDHLTLITRGGLFDVQRLSTIWKMNTGQYDYLLPHRSNP